MRFFTLDRWVALVVLIVFGIYAYTAWFTMDDMLPKILQRNPVWPSSFPKLISITGIIVSALALVFASDKGKQEGEADIDYRKLFQYRIIDAAIIIGLMVCYAFLLRPAGFIASTFLFIVLASALLGERRYWLMITVAVLSSIGIWYLVDKILGIFMRPLPDFLMNYFQL